MNSRRFVDGRLMSSFFKLLGDIRHHLKIHCRCSKETYLDENTLLNYRWQSSADQLPKSVSNFIKKAPIKEVTNLGTTSRIKAAVLLDFVQVRGRVAQIFWHLYTSAFLVIKRSLFPPKS